jgi:hypothetical protein
MNANEVIESYVTDVAVQLPRKQRNDVAFELRALIDEGLQDKAEDAGRAVDAAMAIEFLRAFGRPAEVAARYRPTLTIIDPADGRSFLLASVVGMAIIWGLGLLQVFLQPENAAGILGKLGQWLGGVVVGSLWWPGMLVFGYGMSAWARRRGPQTSDWKPRSGDLTLGSRTGMVMALIGVVIGTLVLIEPRWILDFFWRGRAAPAAYEALTYTDAFLRWKGPCVLALLVLNIPIFIAVIVSGRWSAMLRRVTDAQGLALCAVLVWVVLDGPVFSTPTADKTAKSILVLTIAFTLIDMGIKRYRRVSPAPN